MRVLEDVALERPVVFPVHPRTAGMLDSAGWSCERVRLLNPQGYLRFLSLMLSASAVLTDSGGIQEETTVLGIPCFTLRATTERPITVTEGTNEVLGVGSGALDRFRTELESSPPLGTACAVPEGWDGSAASRCAAALSRRYG